MTQREHTATTPRSADEYDRFVGELEAILRRRYPHWHWDFVRFQDLAPSDPPGQIPAWVRFRASLRDPDDVTIIRYKRWMLLGEPIEHLVVAIGEQMEFERAKILRMHAHGWSRG